MRRIVYSAVPKPENVIGTARFGSVTFELRRGLLATLDGVKTQPPEQLWAAYWSIIGTHPPDPEPIVDPKKMEYVVLAAVQVSWYEERTGAVPASCRKSYARALEMAGVTTPVVGVAA